MNDDSKHVTCGEHGTASTTYVCSHIGDDPLQRWHSSRASADNPWPDAWCDRCNAKFLRDGEWNESDSDGVDLRILCHHCYERALGKSVTRLEGAQLEVWRSFVERCGEELRVKQETLEGEYGLTRMTEFLQSLRRSSLSAQYRQGAIHGFGHGPIPPRRSQSVPASLLCTISERTGISHTWLYLNGPLRRSMGGRWPQ